MFSRQTVFVIGAGASYELGLPLGEHLKAQIAEKLNILFSGGSQQTSGDFQIAEILRRRAQQAGKQDWNYLLYKAWQIRNALPGSLSIDNVLDAHNSDNDLVFCGKLAICQSILAAERESKLYGPRGTHDPTIFQRAAGTYLIPFFQMLTEGVRKEDIGGLFRNVSIITFNYDRCIERFIPEALATYYGIQPREAEQIMENFEIIHPYGQVGHLSENPCVEFGAERADIASIADQLHTFSEGIGDESLQQRLHNLYYNAQQVVFLGFAYHPINLELLNSDGVAVTERVVGTSYGLAPPAQQVSKDLVLQSLGKLTSGPFYPGQDNTRHVSSVDFQNATCAELLTSYFRAIV